MKAPLRNETVKAEAKLNTLHWGLRPFESALRPLATPRDTLPEGRVVYSLILGYKLSVTEAGKHMVTLPRWEGGGGIIPLQVRRSSAPCAPLGGGAHFHLLILESSLPLSLWGTMHPGAPRCPVYP